MTDPVLQKRRFIAGAVCPQCRAQDRLQVEYWRLGANEYQVQCCVACGLRKDDSGSDAPLPTLPRIRRGLQSGEVAAEPVRLVDPAELSGPDKH